MLMEQPGIQSREEKGYTFTTPLEHGLSYKRVNSKHTDFKPTLGHCWKFIERSAETGNEDLVRAGDIAKHVLKGESDLWVSTDESGEVVGCVVIGAATYPSKTGICAEAIGGKFDFNILVPMLEKFYKSCGYEFFEMTGRKGWERKMKPLGYIFSNTTIYKRL
mgnify:CR=1 FL=1